MVGAGSLTAEGPGRGLASCRLGSGATGPHFPEMQAGSGVSGAEGLGLAGSCTTALGSRELCSLMLAAPSWLSNPHARFLCSCRLLHQGGMGASLSDQETEVLVPLAKGAPPGPVLRSQLCVVQTTIGPRPLSRHQESG